MSSETASPGRTKRVAPFAETAIRRAQALHGKSVLGMVVFGSWARDEMWDSSDIDLLIVLADDTQIERELYRRWDEEPLAWAGHPIEPHFVNLPGQDRRISGFWAEIATDGIILFERGQRVSTHLATVRRQIAAGHLRRGSTHGQGYWETVTDHA